MPNPNVVICAAPWLLDAVGMVSLLCVYLDIYSVFLQAANENYVEMLHFREGPVASTLKNIGLFIHKIVITDFL